MIDPAEPLAPLDADQLRQALSEADMPVLAMVMVHLTGDRRWIEEPYQPARDVRLFPDESGGLTEQAQQDLRDAVFEAVLSGAEPVDLPTATLARMMSVAVAEEVSEEYVPLFMEEMGFRDPDTSATDAIRRVEEDERPTAIVIGAGLSGICTGVQLSRAGISYVILEKNPEVGGTWFNNTYPDCGVDTPNHFYSFSFNQRHRWSSYFSKQEEILEYLIDTARDTGVYDHIRFNSTVTRAVWDDGTWSVTTTNTSGTDEVLEADVVLFAVGQLNKPKVPDIDGSEDFEGPAFHTAEWRHDVDLTGKHVGLVGTGASGVQSGRAIARSAAHLTIFQRSPQWLAPNADYHRQVSPEKQYLLDVVPFYATWYRFMLFWRFGDGLYPSLHADPEWEHPERSMNAANERHRKFLTAYIESKLEGHPELLEHCVPTYPPYGKRMLMDNGWLDLITADDVTLVPEAVESFTADGVVDTSGAHHPVDVVVYGTGFHVTRPIFPIEVVGRYGVTLAELWGEEDPRAYLGITVPNFPNLFVIFGPNTGLGHGGSTIFQTEAQVHYAVQCIAELAETGGQLEVTREAYERYNTRIDEILSNMVWAHDGMRNWYKNSKGRVIVNTPWRLVDYWHMTRTVDLEDYHLSASG
ncbi:flavin-containing monooxygenase [Euzebya tangerina]|uniref:flavin-containing monooxygenase n=1 Tax=Euzebya tangerina TaxID=591198 RepID=UPI000E3154FA|nr:NAD(P)/FAD-dependent oxidoreductase [Euzebya tangerina]